jgi:DNA polymerase-3 subunit delta
VFEGISAKADVIKVSLIKQIRKGEIMQRINEDIKKGQFQHIYLLYGEERYLTRQYRDRLKQALSQSVSSMNIHTYEGKNAPIGEIIDLAETVPFFSPHRIFLLDNTGFFKTGGEKLAEYLQEISETAYFIFTEKEVDKRTKLYKTLQSKGVIAEFTPQDENTLKRWIVGLLKKEGKQITESTLQLFLQKTGTDMENIRMELEKLICYTLDHDAVTSQDVEAICTVRITNHIFDMITALAEKQTAKALQLYYDLLALNEPPLRILFLIARQCSLLLTVKEMKTKGHGNKEIAAAISLPPFIAGKYITQATHFQASELKNAVTKCVETEEDIKTGRQSDQLSVEMLLLTVLT